MELRQLEAFAAVAAELHFGRAAESLHMGQATLSELIQRLERELGTLLFTRTTRRVSLTGAGTELLTRSRVILDDVVAAAAAVRRVADGAAGTVRVGITPPVAPVLATHLRSVFGLDAPGVVLDVPRMWLPTLAAAVADGSVDVAITCGLLADPAGVASEVFCAEPLLVGLRAQHRLASVDRVRLSELAHDVLGATSGTLFPAWALTQQQALTAAQVIPPSAPLEATDLAATRWTEQADVDWILLIGSLTAGHDQTVVKPTEPLQLVPFTLQWSPDRAQTAAVARFVQCALTAEPPAGWYTQPAHLRHGRISSVSGGPGGR